MRATLLTIDPGFRYFAYSVFSGDKILEADLCKAKKSDQWDVWTKQPPDFTGLADLILRYDWVPDKCAVIEFPKVHRSTPHAESIVKLASACGAYTSLLQASGFSVEWVEPSAWKGNVPKDVMCKRILAKIKTTEYSKKNKINDHNVIDAIGIGLWKLKKNQRLKNVQT